MEMMNIDFLAFTGHKTLGGPQGIGGFIVKKELAEKIEPFVTGGTGSRSDSFDQPSFLPDKFESGTLNLPGILGLRAALIYLETQDMETLNSHKMALTKQFLDGVREIPGVEPVGLSGVAGRTAVASLNFSDRDNADIAYQLEKRWTILTRVGLHCAPVAHQSLGTFPQGTVRFSIGATNTAQEIDTAIEALRQLMC
jgi:selenocysteine lyase/cysteine desulfurase